MSHTSWQRRLFVDDRLAWRAWSDDQRNRIVDLLAELLVAQLERRQDVGSRVQPEQEKNDDA